METDHKKYTDAAIKKSMASHIKKYHSRKPAIKEFGINDVELQLATFLYALIIDRKPDFKPPDMQSWAREINKMIRLDGRKPSRIRDVIKWCQKDEFWQNNILSTKKLREQFDQLELKMYKPPMTAKEESDREAERRKQARLLIAKERSYNSYLKNNRGFILEAPVNKLEFWYGKNENFTRAVDELRPDAAKVFREGKSPREGQF